METVNTSPTNRPNSPTTEPKPNHATLSSPPSLTSTFRFAWALSTADNDLTLYGFSRFRTAHLLNLRFLEEEIRVLDHRLFQAGFKLGVPPTESDKMWLRYGKVDEGAEGVEDVVTRANVERLRGLLREYDDALIAFNTVVNMECFALTDNMEIARRRIDINPPEAYQTRLVRVDLPSGRSRDPLRGTLTRWLRGLWRRRIDRLASSAENPGYHRPSVFNFKILSHNSVLLTDMIARFLVAIAACVLLVVPLVILSYQERREAHLVTVSVCIVVFSLLVSLASKASNQETMAAAAAYAAVLVVFVGSVPTPSR